MLKSSLNDTIAAISTPIGQGGIGIVRLSGKDAINIAGRIFVSKDKKKPAQFKTYTMHYGRIMSGEQVIDEVILTLMCSPKSYTRENVVEINCHGGLVALRKVLDLVVAGGARLAEPGEFTKRAFLNGRIDLAQAEAVIDVICAKTDSALRISQEQLQGRLSEEIRRIRSGLLGILTLLEAQIDFPEEEIGPAEKEMLGKKLAAAGGKMARLLSGSKTARICKEGIHLVICGKPNVGKSSLLNALLKKERSIVASVPGTTRDTIEEIIDIRGIPVRIVDTAGIIDAKDLVGRKAVQRSKKQIELADLVVMLFDGSRPLSKEDHRLMDKLKSRKVIPVINKIDLRQRIDKEKVRKVFPCLVELSAKKSRNIDLLEDAVVDQVYKGAVLSPEPAMVSSLRHISAISAAEKLIAEAGNSLDNNLSGEFIAQGVKDALVYLDNILGKDYPEDLLDKIFSRFCIGK